jgi:hypothetical protein
MMQSPRVSSRARKKSEDAPWPACYAFRVTAAVMNRCCFFVELRSFLSLSGELILLFDSFPAQPTMFLKN